jgi:NADH:ubiquinone oxidoreductase subunit C
VSEGRLHALLGSVPGASVDEGYGLTTVDVAVEGWRPAVAAARGLGWTFLDFLSAVDEPEGFRVVCHLVATDPFGHLAVRTLLPREAPSVASVAEEYAGAAWHERETAEMFGVTFEGHPQPVRLLLPEPFEGHPMRKDFPLMSRVVKPWPGAAEGEEEEEEE